MALAVPVDLVSRILTELWAYPFQSNEEQIEIFTTCNLVSRQWSAIMKEVTSMHSWIPFSYNKGHLYTVKPMHVISNTMLCRTITVRVEYVIMPQVLVDTRCKPSIAANRGIESMFRRIFGSPNPPRDATHIYVDFLDDPQVHIPDFWIPPQVTQLTIIYHFHRWVAFGFRCHLPIHCECEQLAIDRWVSDLTVMGSSPVIVERLIAPLDKWKCLISLTSNIKDVNVSAASPISVICKPYNFPFLDVRRDYACRAMFGGDSSWWLQHPYHSFRAVHRDIPMFEQVIPVGSVGYINPITRKFVVLFNAIDPASSTDQRIKSIPSLLEGGATKLIFDPNYSSFPDWEREYTYSDLSDVGALFGAWFEGRTVHSIPMDCDRAEWLCLAVGRVFARELVGSHFDSWLLEHKETILEVFGEDHPFVRRRLDLVTTTIDTAQYAWFLLYPKTGWYIRDQYFYFQVNPRASLTPGSLWGNFVKQDGFPDNMITWSHISTVGQSPMTVEICCHSFEQTDGVWYGVVHS